MVDWTDAQPFKIDAARGFAARASHAPEFRQLPADVSREEMRAVGSVWDIPVSDLA
ncbi:MAG TPA: hypothetical protein VGD30_07425 [Telluria sp.]